MRELVECVPNFSTSDSVTVDKILEAITSVKGVLLLDHSYDDYYNRLVVTVAGEGRDLVQAVLSGAVKAVELIDMKKHRGLHPRLGAVDVVPFVPIANSTIDSCSELAKDFGSKFSAACNVPVYLYAESASSLERRDIDWIREGEYEGLEERIHRPDRKPDFGHAQVHPTAGATITGARKPMVGFNVNLSTHDAIIGKKIARALHEKKGGLAGVRAMAAEIPKSGVVQIGISVYDYEKTPLYRVYELLKLEAQRHNLSIIGSEFNGMAPLGAVLDVANYYLRVTNLNDDRIIETAICKRLQND
jgi:glutamate formiminotransferase / 5-formyltetrahydrofolate cyclo-ligase